MKFNNSNNNSRDAVNVNTRGPQFMNADGFFPSTMLFGYWNEMISIKMHPALEKSQQTDSKRFNYEEVVSTAITLEKATTLADKIENDVLPAFKEGNEVFRGIPVGGDSLIGVGTKNHNDKMVSFVAIFKALDETTKKPEVAIYYEFKAGYTVDDYNPESGQFNVTQNVPGELTLFLHALRSAVNGLVNANAHATRAVDKWFRDRITNTLDEIGSKVGVEARSKGNFGGGGGNYKSRDIFGGGGNSAPKNNAAADLDGGDASFSKLSNINEIDQFMN
jgi:hypothetical protein